MGEKGPRRRIVIEHVEQWEKMCDAVKPQAPGLLKQIDNWSGEARQLLNRLMKAPEEQRPALAASHDDGQAWAWLSDGPRRLASIRLDRDPPG